MFRRHVSRAAALSRIACLAAARPQSAAAVEEDTGLPPLPASEYDEPHDLGQQEEPADDLGLHVAVDHLLDDFMACRIDVLKNFARTRGTKHNAKPNIVAELVQLAKTEATRPHDFNATRRVLGEDVSQHLPSSNVRTAWTNSSLEASMLENACARVVQGHGTTLANSVRAESKRASWITQRLLRMYQDDYAGVSTAAVGGIYRSYRETAARVFDKHGPSNVIAAYSSFLCHYVNVAHSPHLVSVQDIATRMTELGLVHPSVDDGELRSLERLMDMLDDVAAEVQARWDCFADAQQRPGWGKDLLATLRIGLESQRRRHAATDFDDVPPAVQELAAQFMCWEAIVRNDIPALRDAPNTFFDALLLNVAAGRALSQIQGDVNTKPSTDIPPAYRTLVKEELLAFLKDQEAVDEVLLKLCHYVQVERAERGTVTPKLFEAVHVQMQATIPEENARAPADRIAIILGEYATTAQRGEACAGLYPLLVNVTEKLMFHLRFAPVYDKLTSRERTMIRTSSSVNFFKTLAYFEKHHKVEPLDAKCVSFIVFLLTFFCSRNSATDAPVLTRYASATGSEDLGVVTFTNRQQINNMARLSVAFPPQLSYQSWLEADPSKGIYNIVPASAVKSATSGVMLMSHAPIIKALDAISRVPWRINKYMLHVQEAMVQEGYGFGKIRPAFYPLSYARMKNGVLDQVDGRNIVNRHLAKKYNDQMDKDWRDLQDVRSSRVHYLQALRQARALLNVNEVFFPHNLDFRGRMYPLPGRLNHTGSDPFRALLEYAHPKRLGEVGLFWLKVHLANKMGHTKITFKERANFVDQHIEDIVQSAEAPLSGDRWWQEGEEPLQALMACKELADALKCSQGPENYESRLPVAVDGSYNGLQHYSAIGRDEHGATLVNLLPGEKPSDAYTGILKEMMKSMTADAERDSAVAQRCLGSGRGMDKNHIRRKTIKRPIMTQVYGVTAYGMREQIKGELVNQNKAHGLWSPAEMSEMATYICDKIVESLGVTFGQTQKCREWLSDVGRLVWECQPKDLHSAFMWTTPLGLVVRQPYRVGKEAHLFTAQGYTRIGSATLEPASKKQLSALAPNLIHSLDATHMAMTAIEMQNRDLSMMAVHDSFWTYACDLPVLSSVLREQFCDLYTHYDPLWELKQQWEELYFLDLRRHGARLPDPPERGALDLKAVLQSEYFFA